MIPLHHIITDPANLSFPLGEIYITYRAAQALRRLNLDSSKYIQRHCSEDWGDIDAGAAEENQLAIVGNGAITSRYILGNTKEKLVIITDAYRTTTTLLLPNENLHS